MIRAALPLALLLPVACAPPQQTDAAAALEGALVTHRASLAGIGGLPAASPAAPAAAEPRSAGVERPASGGAAPAMAGQLVGQTPDTVVQWLGVPRLRREEGPAEIWHYQASQCHLDLVLYREDGPQPTLRVAFAAARAVGTARRGEAACLRDIARDAARPGPGGPGDFARTG
jgi:hypothetical protein